MCVFFFAENLKEFVLRQMNLIGTVFLLLQYYKIYLITYMNKDAENRLDIRSCKIQFSSPTKLRNTKNLLSETLKNIK